MRQEYTLRETIHHGDYYNVRDVLIQETVLSWSTFLASLEDSPYNANRASEPNDYTREAYEAIVKTGHGDIGWARYDVVDRVTVFDHPVYVKTGLAGYGPDLDDEDTGHTDIDSILASIDYELQQSAEMLHEDAATASATEDFKRYHDARELADHLDGVRANFDPKRRNAPLFTTGGVDFDTHIWEHIERDFPVAVDVDGNIRLYVWEASE